MEASPLDLIWHAVGLIWHAATAESASAFRYHEIAPLPCLRALAMSTIPPLFCLRRSFLQVVRARSLLILGVHWGSAAPGTRGVPAFCFGAAFDRPKTYRDSGQPPGGARVIPVGRYSSSPRMLPRWRIVSRTIGAPLKPEAGAPMPPEPRSLGGPENIKHPM